MKPPDDRSLRQLVFREILLALKCEIASDEGGDLADRTWADQSPLAGPATRRLNAIRLAAIEAALKRIDRGDYGRCVDCGQDIPDRRLAAIPWAARCIACEERSSFRGASEDRPGRNHPGGNGRSWS